MGSNSPTNALTEIPTAVCEPLSFRSEQVSVCTAGGRFLKSSSLFS